MKKFKIIVSTFIGLDKQKDIREYEYRSVLNFLKLNCECDDVIVVETENYSESFLNEYPFETIYSGFDNHYKNKGCNEISALLFLKDKFEALYTIKLTGRYLPISTNFFDTVSQCSLDYDGVIKLSSNKLWTGCFAYKTEQFFEILERLDLEFLENRYICIEDAIWDQIKSKKNLILENLDIMARIGENNFIDFM